MLDFSGISANERRVWQGLSTLDWLQVPVCGHREAFVLLFASHPRSRCCLLSLVGSHLACVSRLLPSYWHLPQPPPLRCPALQLLPPQQSGARSCPFTRAAAVSVGTVSLHRGCGWESALCRKLALACCFPLLWGSEPCLACCLMPENSCLIYFVQFYICLGWRDIWYCIVARSRGSGLHIFQPEQYISM